MDLGIDAMVALGTVTPVPGMPGEAFIHTGERRCLSPSPTRSQGPLMRNSAGDTVEFRLFSEHRDLPAAKRFFRRALEHHGRADRVVIDGIRPSFPDSIISII